MPLVLGVWSCLPADEKALAKILGGKYVMAYERHSDLARELGLPERIILESYEDMVEGAVDDLFEGEELVILGDE